MRRCRGSAGLNEAASSVSRVRLQEVDQGLAGGDLALLVDVADVGLHGALGKHELLLDVGNVAALRDEP